MPGGHRPVLAEPLRAGRAGAGVDHDSSAGPGLPAPGGTTAWDPACRQGSSFGPKLSTGEALVIIGTPAAAIRLTQKEAQVPLPAPHGPLLLAAVSADRPVRSTQFIVRRLSTALSTPAAAAWSACWPYERSLAWSQEITRAGSTA